MKNILETTKRTQTYDFYGPSHMIRPRINALLANANKNSVVIVCAGAGCGKTRAVSDFIRTKSIPTIWIQFSERDNIGTHFWETYVKAVAQIDPGLADEHMELGFPDTDDKLNQYLSMIHGIADRQCLYVLDDFHLLNNPSVLRFIEQMIYILPPNKSLILISRELPKINIINLHVNGIAPIIEGTELNFTDSELSQYINEQSLIVERQSLHDIMQDTKGWAFAVNLIVRSLKNAPGYSGFVQNAMKKNIFQLFEQLVWSVISEELRRFLCRLSLIDHLSVDLLSILSKGNAGLMDELTMQNAYICFDHNMDCYVIHHLFLDFLRTKQEILTEEECAESYKAAADWCLGNGLKAEALSYYKKIEDYESIVNIFFELPAQLPHDIALYTIDIFEQAPAAAFEQVSFLAAIHLRTVLCLGRWEEFVTLAHQYEQKFLAMPEDNVLRNHTLHGIYYIWACLRCMMSTFEDCYDFDVYFAKMFKCQNKLPKEMLQVADFQRGPWINLAGSSRQGAPQEYIDALIRAEQAEITTLTNHGTPFNYDKATIGADKLSQGELLFYQGNIKKAEYFVVQSLESARKRQAHDTVHRALFYLLRIAAYQGNYSKAEQALGSMETLLDEKRYLLRFTTFDIATGWFHYILRQPKFFPIWLKESFAPYFHAFAIENFGNQIKARYCYLTKNYYVLLAYIDEIKNAKKQETILYGRVEMLAMEACVHYQINDKQLAYSTLREAYEVASPNEILMPFIELGKDMQTLSTAAKRADCGIPNAWLDEVKRRSSTYAKHQSLFISDHIRANNINDAFLTPRENEILHDLYRGLSRPEIAARLNISLTRLNNNINKIYEKLGASSLADVIRIVNERNLI